MKNLTGLRQQSTLRIAICLAALASNRDGKRYSQRRRLSKIVLEQARDVLLENGKEICKSHNFDDLFALFERLLLPIKGIGELYVYDTALRIGAKIGVYPERVYLHA